ncbi:hypothetical protein OBPA_26750 [Polaribacter sp. OB-PA-B3]
MFFVKYNAFAPYSPILFGVINDAVSDAKDCFAAVIRLMFFNSLTSVFHFNISNNQFMNVSMSRKLQFLNEKSSDLIKTLLKSSKDNNLLKYSFCQIKYAHINTIVSFMSNQKICLDLCVCEYFIVLQSNK